MLKQNGRVSQAVILAAGNGSRMAAEWTVPKPLVPVAERPLLEHILGWVTELGIDTVYLVVGYGAPQIRRRFTDFRGLELEWVYNPLYEHPNGVSLLAVEDLMEAPFLLLMSDHFFELSTLKDLLRRPIPEDGGILATDSKIAKVFDLEDATKVRCSDKRVKSMGKDLDEYNAVDTGMFLLTPSVFPAMRASQSRGDASLTGGILELACQSTVESWDIGPRRWIDIDTPEAREEAERLVSKGHFNGLKGEGVEESATAFR